MGWNIYKGINLGNLLRINLTKSGIGLSGGVKGIRAGIGPRGGRFQFTIPGTGIYYRKNISPNSIQESVEEPQSEIAEPESKKLSDIKCEHLIEGERLRIYKKLLSIACVSGIIGAASGALDASFGKTKKNKTNPVLGAIGGFILFGIGFLVLSLIGHIFLVLASWHTNRGFFCNSRPGKGYRR